MIISSKSQKKNRLRLYGLLGKGIPSSRRRFAIAVIIVFLWVFSIGATAMIAQWMYRYGYQGPHKAAVEIKQFALKVLYLPTYLKAISKPLPHLQIDIKFKDWEKLVAIREASLKRGDIVKTGDDFVPCTISFNDKTVHAKARFKGNALDNISGDIWALRFKVSGDEPVLGAMEFSLHPPETVDEWTYPFYLFAMKREGIAVPRFQFVTVTLNGKDQGLEGWEEEMRPELIEFNQRREGIILGYDESLAWRNWKDSVARNSSPFINWQNTEIQIFGESKTKKFPSLGAQAKVAASMMEDFRSGKKKASEVFDVPLLSKYLALNSLLGGGHSSLFRNIRILYNPISSKLEPIARDGSEVNGTRYIDYLMAEEGSMYMTGGLFPEQKITTRVDDQLGTIHRAWFSDPVILEAYIRELQRVTTKEYISKLIHEADSLNKTNLAEFQQYKAGTTIDYDYIEKNRQTIDHVLHPAECLQTKAQPNGGKIAISYANLTTLPVEILAVRINDKVYPVNAEDKKLLKGKAPSDVLKYVSLVIENPPPARASQDPYKVEILHKVFAVEDQRTIAARWNSTPFTELVADQVASGAQTTSTDKSKSSGSASNELKAIFSKNSFLTNPEGTKDILVKQGFWNVSGNIILPPGYSLKAGPGTSLYFENGGYMIVTGPVDLQGTENQPILFSAQADRWGGILIRNAATESKLDHVIFERTEVPKMEGIAITGGVTFYECNATIENCIFRDSLGEDSLNGVHTRLNIHGCTFDNSYSDTLDTDFSELHIRDTNFSHIGDDAIDISTTHIWAENVHIEDGRDKGFSVGEGSTADMIQNSFVKHMKTGIVCKDGSTGTAQSLNLVSNVVGAAVYVHKQHFGGGKLDAKDLKIVDCDKPTQIEKGSTFILDGKEQPSNAEKVWDDFQKLGKKVKK